MRINVSTQNRVDHLRNNHDLLIGLYCGLWAGDGSQFYDKGYCVKICLHDKNKKLIEFVQKLLFDLFGKTSRYVLDHGKNSGIIIFKSKFIFQFVNKYLRYEQYKTYTVQFRDNISKYSTLFLEGFFLGAMLSDGYLQKRLVYQTISIGLAKNIRDLLRLFGYHPNISTARREKYGWNDLHAVYISQKETFLAEQQLSAILQKVNYNGTFITLKGIYN